MTRPIIARRRGIVAALAAATAALTCTAGADAAFVSFRTPSSNIGCAGDNASPVTIRCDIAKRSWAPPKRPKSCPFDYGQGISVGAKGRAAFVCAGDTALNRDRVLAYGTSTRIGSITCTSRTTGMTCRNRAGHGFLISKERYRIF